MKTFLLLLVFAAACTAYALPQSGRRIARTAPTVPVQPPVNVEPEVTPPKPAPKVLTFLPEQMLERRIRTLENNYFRLADFQGKVLVINFWASWCGPCRKEVPEYDNVRMNFLGRDVEFIGLTTEDPASSSHQVNRFVRQTNFGFLLGWADRELARTLMNGRGSIPQTLVIDTGGNVVSHWVGYSPGRLKEAVENALR